MTAGVAWEADLARAQREVGWTETRIRVAAAMFNAGLSAREVACTIGNVSRNGVIGKMHRGNLVDMNRQLPKHTNGLAKSGFAPRRSRPKTTRTAVVNATPQPKAWRHAPHVLDAAIPAEQRKSLFQLTDTCCHWPVGDPLAGDFFFCGAPKDAEAGPYCPSHMRRAHQAGTP